MKIALDEMLAVSTDSSPSTLTMMKPSGMRRRCRKFYQRGRCSPQWSKWYPSRSIRTVRIHDRSAHSKKDDYFEPTTPSPGRDNYDPFEEYHSPQPAPVTPQRGYRRSGPSTPSSTRSAPARLQRSPGSDKNISAQDIDSAIIKQLEERLPEKQRNNEKFGNIYLFGAAFADDPDRTIMKIGRTQEAAYSRIKQIESQCQPISMEREVAPEGWLIPFYKRAEKLMHAHLWDRRHAFACVCGAAHREYFDVDAAAALAVIQLWRAFFESDPYDAAGELRPFWRHRLRQLKKVPYRDRVGSEDLCELDRRRGRWEAFANPNPIEMYWFHATTIFAEVWPFRLPIIAVVEALLIVLFIFPNFLFSCVLFSLISACIYIE